jgi:NDP-sugar pyrophosphorylase family protein
LTRHALILAAGLGTRLAPLTDVRAKPAIPVAGEPIVRRIIRWLASCGIDNVVINLHHRPHTLTAVVGDARDLGVRVRYSWEPQILGSAGGPLLARPILGADRFWIVNGDTLTDVDLAALEASHDRGARVTLALVPNREFLRYGGVGVDSAGRVTGFTRRGPGAEGSFHYIGVQLADADVFDAASPGVPTSTIGGIYDACIAAQPGAIRGFVSSAAFFDVGTPADYWRTSQAFAGLPAAASPAVETVSIDASAHVTRSILWDHVQIGPGAALDECIVTDGVAVPAGATYRRKILIAGPNAEPRAVTLDL